MRLIIIHTLLIIPRRGKIQVLNIHMAAPNYIISEVSYGTGAPLVIPAATCGVENWRAFLFSFFLSFALFLIPART